LITSLHKETESLIFSEKITQQSTNLHEEQKIAILNYILYYKVIYRLDFV